ncbi:right-handed parallel beta-helix repeat-containing protein [Candidatus Laterigemmans baculatus]|uniref:right-handed parallel beta-helix repeat-containing protein n=1 Tax=Candidatus Laterigemmans baculatus TaxID=2770505 RepID=UPI0013DC7A89|nr:right-handed parallel beta-helix repeat-containing protein [Candidatus Laterigemmans baculatus]
MPSPLPSLRLATLPLLCTLGFAAFPLAVSAADITAELQAAIDSGAGLVEVPPGQHELSRTLRVDLAKHGRTVIRGRGASRLVMTAAGPAIEIVGTHAGTAAPQTVKPQVWEKENAPRIEDLEIVGEHPEADGIRLIGTMQPTLRDLVIRRVRHAIHLVERNRNVLISDCHLYENRGAGVFYDAVNLHQSNIVGCHISYNAAGGVVIRGGDVRNVHITGCDIEGNMGGADSEPTANVVLDSRGGSIGEVAITGCTIQHTHDAPGSANIRIDGDSQAVRHTEERRHGNITISGNVLSDVQINVHLRNTRGVTLAGNTAWKGFEHNLLVENCDSVAVAGNVFDRNPRYHYGDGGDANLGLKFVGCRGCSLSGNVIHGSGREVPPLWLVECEEMIVSGGSITEFGELAVLWEQVRNSRLSDCLIRGGQGDRGAAIRDRDGEGNVIEAAGAGDDAVF